MIDTVFSTPPTVQQLYLRGKKLTRHFLLLVIVIEIERDLIEI
jgi:hypothetical protein